MTARARFTQGDVQRVIRALQAAGHAIGGVEVRADGSFRVLTGGAPSTEGLSPLERWERENGDRAA